MEDSKDWPDLALSAAAVKKENKPEANVFTYAAAARRSIGGDVTPAGDPGSANLPGQQEQQQQPQGSWAQSQTWDPKKLGPIKAKLLALDRETKLQRLANHCFCDLVGCKCRGWRISTPVLVKLEDLPSSDSDEAATPMVEEESPHLLCAICGHSIEAHLQDFITVNDKALDKLVEQVMDIETITVLLNNDPEVLSDPEVEQIYQYLRYLLGVSLTSGNPPTPDFATMGAPPFELPSIGRGITVLFSFKFKTFRPGPLAAAFTLTRILLYLINHCKLDPPSVAYPEQDSAASQAYKHIYRKWLTMCYAPTIFNSLQRVIPVQAFGRQFLRLIFPNVRKQFMEEFDMVKGNMENSKRSLYDKLISLLLEAVDRTSQIPGGNIWGPGYKVKLPLYAFGEEVTSNPDKRQGRPKPDKRQGRSYPDKRQVRSSPEKRQVRASPEKQQQGQSSSEDHAEDQSAKLWAMITNPKEGTLSSPVVTKSPFGAKSWALVCGVNTGESGMETAANEAAEAGAQQVDQPKPSTSWKVAEVQVANQTSVAASRDSCEKDFPEIDFSSLNFAEMNFSEINVENIDYDSKCHFPEINVYDALTDTRTELYKEIENALFKDLP